MAPVIALSPRWRMRARNGGRNDNRAREAAKGQARVATAERDAALAALDDEMSALRHQPQLLEKLGIAARSSSPATRKANRTAEEDAPAAKKGQATVEDAEAVVAKEGERPTEGANWAGVFRLLAW